MDRITDWLHRFSNLPDSQQRIIYSLLTVITLWIIRTVVIRMIWRRTEDAHIRYRWQKSTIYIAVGIGIIMIGRIWFHRMESLATFLGLVTAGLAIALQSLIKSLAGWAFILWRKPFSVGDRIQVNNYSGDVIDIRIFKFTLMEIGNWVDADQSTGRVIHLPNSMVIDEVVANYSKGFEFIWNEIPVLVTFESNWEKAKGILMDIAGKHGADLSATAESRIREASKKYMIFYSKLTPTVYTTVKDSGVLLTIRYLIPPRQRRGSNQAIWEDILRAFAACDDIDFAYPTQRFYDNAGEGKDGARKGPASR
ncbi:MAG: mechanosensitive ion channel family protein [Proteobacteria bacterium]|nr:mechanosensitive ion channel family protein [Pseudomonadota bacterium]MBU1737530.1 mechanosensitive ion channel family protein [Pseudomonadota bacterium]